MLDHFGSALSAPGAERLLAWAAFAALWAGVGRSDLRLRRIPHGWLAAGLAAAALLFLWDAAGRRGEAARWWAGAWGSHAGATAALGVGLWLSGVWPAGDAKLFVLLGLLAPHLARFEAPSPSFGLLLAANSFLLAALYTFGRAGFSPAPAGTGPPARLAADARTLARALSFGIFLGAAATGVARLAAPWLGASSALWCWALAAAFSPSLSHSVMGTKFRWRTCAWALGGGLGLLAWLEPGDWAAGAARAAAGGALAQALGLLGAWLQARTCAGEARAIPARGDLRRAVLSEAFRARLSEDPGFLERLDTLRPDGLDRRQERLVRAWCRISGVREVEVMSTVPFASWLFAGAAATALAKAGLAGWAARLLAASLRA